jgi:hypothetical protein
MTTYVIELYGLMFHCVYNYFIGNRRKRSDITDNNKPGSCPSTTVDTCVEAIWQNTMTTYVIELYDDVNLIRNKFLYTI